MFTLEENQHNTVHNIWICIVIGDSNFDAQFQDSVCQHIVFLAGATNHINEVSIIDVCYLDAPDPNNFIPYANVTPEILKNWLFQKVDQTLIENNNAMVLGNQQT